MRADMAPLISPPTLLIAEDDSDDRRLIADAFAAVGIFDALRFVGDGSAVLDYLRQRGEFANRVLYPRPRVVLLDLNMPKMDGREVLRAIRADGELRDLPVLILTTSSAEEDEQLMIGLGADGYLVKPVSFGALVTMVASIKERWLQAQSALK